MSGGSYDYLCYKDSDQIFSSWNSLREMAARLDGLCPEAAAETRLFAEGPATLLTAVETHLDRLKPLWKAVEWRDSADWGEDQLTEAVREYRELPPAPGQVDGADRIQRIRDLVAQASGTLTEALNVTLTDAGALPPVPPTPPGEVGYRTGDPDARNIYQVSSFGEDHRGVMFTEYGGQMVVRALNEFEQRHPYGASGGRVDVFARLLTTISHYCSWQDITTEMPLDERELWADMIDAHYAAIGMPESRAPRWWQE